MRIGAPRGRWCCCALLIAALGAPARAEEPVAAVAAPLEACGGAGPETLEVIAALPAPASDAALRRAICDWFRDDRWRVRFSSRAVPFERPSTVMRVALELSSPHHVQLNADGPLGPWTHQISLEAGLGDAGIEAIAEALHSAAQAAIAPPIVPPSARPSRAPALPPLPAAAGAELPPLEAAPVTAAGEREVAPRPRAKGEPLPVHTGLGYQAYVRGPEPVMHGPALHIELDALSRGVTLGASFRASVFTSATRRTTGFDVRTSGASLSLGASASVPVAGLTARAGLGGGVDLVALSVRVNDLALVRRLPERETSPRPFVGGEAGVSYRMGAFELSLGALLRLLWFDTPYQALTPDGAITLLRPWQLQPGALLELGYVW